MPPGEQIAFEPALAHVLAEHLHDAAVGREMLVGRQDRLGMKARSVASKTALEAVRGRLVGAERRGSCVAAFCLIDVAQERAQRRASPPPSRVPGFVTSTA